MKTIYENRKRVTRMMARCSQGVAKVYPRCSQALGRLMSMPRVSLEAAWSMLRVCLQYAYSMPRVCLAYAYTHLIRKPYAISVRARRTASPLLTDRESAPYGLFLTLLLLISGVVGSWGQTDYSGIYFIANGKQLESPAKYYDKNNPSVNFYLCPAQYYYNPEGSGTDVVSETNNTGKPFITTFKTNQGDNSIWLIEKVENKSTYYIKYIGVGDDHDKYVIKNPSLKSNLSGVDDTRLRVHLEEKAKSELNTDAEFEIIQYGEGDNIYYGIRISTITNGWLNPSKGNKQAYVPDATAYIGGIIGYYKDKLPNETGGEGSKWFLEKVPPVISYNSSNLIEISYTDASYSIYYSYGEDSTPSSSTLNYSETGPFDPPAGTTTIKAIAIKDGKESGVATFTPTFLLGSTHKYLIQAQGNGWATGNFQGNHYYMIPGDKVGEEPNKITKVNTTSMLRPSMQWYFLNAGDNYYYIVNNVDDTRMRYNATNYVHMDTWDDNNANEFKFQIVASSTAGTYNIIPYGVTANNKYLNKASGNAGDGALGLHNSATDANSRWKFVPQDTPLADTPPFTPSGAGTSVYYKIQNGNGTTYHLTPPASAGGNATASNATDDATVRSMSWYFMQVEAPTTTDWLTYYKIINAVTGKALYYAYTANNSPCLKVGDYDGSNDYKFAFVKSTKADYYYIVPKSHKDDQLNKISTFYREGTNIKPATTRDVSSNIWTFIPADLFCNAPEFVEEEGKIRIKCNTNSAKIYINTESNADPTIAEENLYAPTTKENQNWATTSQVRIKAIASVSDGTNSASSAVATLLNKPDFTLTEGGNAVADNTYTYDGTAKQPDVTEVSIGEDANKTTATKTTHFTMSYSNNIKAGTPISENPPTVTLVDVPGDDMYVWNTSKTFTINKKPVTITADSDTKVYDGTELTKNSYTNTDLADGDAITSVTVTGSQIVVGTSANVPSGAVIKKGEEDRTACYEITYTNGTLEVTKKAVTITADSDTKVYDGTALTKNSYTNTALAEGDAIESVTVTGSQIVVGESNNVPSAAVIRKGEEDRTACYEITYTNGTLEVTKKALTITADSDTKVYDGTALTKNSYTNTALAEGDAIESVTVTGSQTDVGSSANVPSGAVIKKDTEDRTSCYEITYTNGTLTVTGIGVIVTADNKTKEYSKDPTTDPTLTATVTGLVGTDVITYTISRVAGEDVNDYVITPTGESKQGNYTVTYVPGTFTITPTTLTITPNDGQTKEYGDADPAFTFTPTGLKGTDAIADVVQGTLTRAEGENRGTYAFNQGTLAIATGNNNYTLAYANPNNYVFTISQKPLTSTDITINIDESTNLITVVVTHAKSDGDYILSQKESETDPEYDYSLATVGEGDPGYNPNYFKTRITGNGNYSGYVDIRQAIVHFTTDANQAEWSATFVAEKAGTTDIGHVLPEGIAAYIISGIEGSWAIPEPMDYIPAGVPVLLVAHEEKTGFLVRDAKSENVTDISEEQIGYNKLKEVTAESAHFNTRQIYVLYKNEFVLNKEGDLVKGKVYMENPKYVAPSPSSPAPASLSIAWGNVTGIEDGRWKMEDGNNEHWYTLDGRCLIGKPTAKGLYIVNGKKRVVK